MSLKNLKAKIGKAVRFTEFKFLGINDCLALEQDGKLIPLTVGFHPPSVSFILESGALTSMILKHSPTYRSLMDDEKPSVTAGSEEKIKEELTEGFKEDFKSPAERIAMTMKVSRHYLAHKSIYGLYEGNDTRYKIHFIEDPSEAARLNAKSDELTAYIPIDNLTEQEIIEVGMTFINVTDESGGEVQVPIKEVVFNSDTNEAEEVVSESVGAESLAMFPRTTRLANVVDAPTQHSGGVGDSE